MNQTKTTNTTEVFSIDWKKACLILIAPILFIIGSCSEEETPCTYEEDSVCYCNEIPGDARCIAECTFEDDPECFCEVNPTDENCVECTYENDPECYCEENADDEVCDTIPAGYETQEEIEAQLNESYSRFTNYYGNESIMKLTVYGTDEFSNGSEAFGAPFNTYAGIDANADEINWAWNASYGGINICNGLIAYAPMVDMSDQMKLDVVAEAKFIRAQLYFNLVRTFGGVTLRLEYEENPDPVQERSVVAEIYDVIIDDLEAAIVDLPDMGATRGKASGAAATHLLSKVYLAKGWLENSGADFNNALINASKVINDYGELSLQADFEDIHDEFNSDNSEVILSVPRPGADATGTRSDNHTNFVFRPHYERMSGMMRDMENGRPWIRFRPTDFLMFEVFNADDDAYLNIDTRFNKSFQTEWFANDTDDLPEGMQLGDLAVWIPGIDLSQEDIDALAPAAILTPSVLSDIEGSDFGSVLDQFTMFPSLSKYDDTQRSNANDPSIRPFIVYKLSEAYLIAAEANLMLGNTSESVQLINVIRERAAADGMESDMQITTSDVDIDFILDERSRELVGESMRWFDLVRTGKLVERVGAHNLEATGIQQFHTLRPIPQSVLEDSPGYEQNPGY